MNGILGTRALVESSGSSRSERVISSSGVIERGGGIDALDGIPFALRLQTHRGEMISQDAFQVSGAGVPGSNGDYRQSGFNDGKHTYNKGGQFKIYYANSDVSWHIYDLVNFTEIYRATGNVATPDLATGWSVMGTGITPAPSVARIEISVAKSLGLYKDTACTIPATSDGDLVAAWRDELSRSGISFTQIVVTQRPTLRFVNGKPVIRFDGVDDFLSGNIPAYAYQEQISIGLGANTTFAPVGFFSIGEVSEYDNDTIIGCDSPGNILAQINNGGDGSTSMPWPNTASTVTVVFDGNHNSIQLRVNGVLAGTTIYTPPNKTSGMIQAMIGRYTGSPSQWHLNGEISTLVISTSALGEADRRNLESYISVLQ